MLFIETVCVIEFGSDGEKHDLEVSALNELMPVLTYRLTFHLVNTACEGLVVHEVRLLS